MLFASICSLIIALLHIVAIFIGAPAYNFMDAPDLAIWAEQGSSYPTYVTLVVTFFFTCFGLYGLSAARVIPKLPFLEKGISIIGWIYTLRGLALIYFVYLWWIQSPNFIFREIFFSSVSLLLGILYLVKRKDLTSNLT